MHTDTLKDYALALYGGEGVSAACLTLQERTGLDVNILLFAAWMGAARGRALGAEEVAQAQSLISDWHKEIVRPLRAVRRRLKTGPLPAPSEATGMLRVRLQALEISAEIIELEELGALGLHLGSQSGTGTPQDMAALGMLAVVEAAAGRAPETEEKDAVEIIARAAAETAL
ncbi:TIGR02444 family protein [Aquabacter sp. CN5-332]|uniref:TIGR02444 family protein n=1 Tax=Aquabacter sp. CN5-332 TaxID=3156608 RepID=UPI0032B5A0A0